MKKRLTMLLVMLLCLLCAGAAADCTHEETYSDGYDGTALHKQIGNIKQHLVYYEEHQYTACTLCGSYLSDECVGTVIMFYENHDWNELGVCSSCGQKNECKHDGEMYSELSARNHQRKQIGDIKYHQATYDRYNTISCALCGLCLSEEYVDTETRNENHIWEEGVERCWTCLQEMTCAHPEKGVEIIERRQDKQIGDAKRHQVSFDQYQYTTCEICGLRFQDGEYVGTTARYDEDHDWNELGVCNSCGQKNECEHGETYSEWSDRNHQYEQTGDAKYHQVTYERYNTINCALCGLRLSEEYVRNITENWKHNWNRENICYDCGQENECAHGSMASIMYKRNRRYESIGDSMEHQVTYDLYEIKTCALCGLRVSDEYVETKTENESHSWNDKGICRQCGQENTCTHPETCVEYYHSDRTEVKQIGDVKKHLFCLDRYEYTVCMTCGQRLSEDKYARTETYYQSHSWLEEGFCEECGQKNACAHGETCSWIDEGNERFEQIGDEKKHRMVYDRYEVTGCALCGLRLSEKYVDTKTRSEHHEWDDGICGACGQENVCTHEGATHTQEELWDWRSVSCVDDKTHKLNGRMHIFTYCDLCNAMLSEELLDWQWMTAEHSMDGGQCWYCEYAIGCEHAHMVAKQLPRTVYCEAISDTAHVTTYRLYAYDYCEDCDSLFENTGIPAGMETIEEPHQFTDLGICESCGYENTCGHAETHEERIVTPVSEYTAKDEFEHTCLADIVTETRCTTCNQRIAFTEERGVECAEEHVFDSVADMICDLCGYEREEPEEAETPEPTPESTPEPTETPAPTKAPGGGSGGTDPESPTKPRPTATPAVPQSGEVVQGENALQAMPPVEVPTLVFSHASEAQSNVKVEFIRTNVSTDSSGKKSMTYDVELTNSAGDKINLPGTCILCFPYPKGQDEISMRQYRITIHHYPEGKGMETFSTEDGTIELTKQGLCIRVSSLSPFMIAWEQLPKIDLPQTGDSSQIGLWLVLAALAGVALMILKRRTV